MPKPSQAEARRTLSEVVVTLEHPASQPMRNPHMPCELLTSRQVERLSKPGRYSDGAGLYLVIGDSGNKSWLLRYTSPVSGRERWHGLGACHTLNLGDAREAARLARLLIRAGTDVIEHRRQEKRQRRQEHRATTFKALAEEQHRQIENRYKNVAHWRQWWTHVSS